MLEMDATDNLAHEWAKRNHAESHVEKRIPVTDEDVYAETHSFPDQDDYLDYQDERRERFRRARRVTVYTVSDDNAQAALEDRLIYRFHVAILNGFVSPARRQKARQALIDIGYPASVLDSLPVVDINDYKRDLARKAHFNGEHWLKWEIEAWEAEHDDNLINGSTALHIAGLLPKLESTQEAIRRANLTPITYTIEEFEEDSTDARAYPLYSQKQTEALRR